MNKIVIKYFILNLFCILSLTGTPVRGFAEDLKDEISIQETGKVLLAPQGSQYSWSFNQKSIVAENEQTLSPKESGTYTVSYLDTNGTQTSTSIAIMVSAEGRIIRIFTIGDSTVQDYDPYYYPQIGWGQVLPFFFDTGVTVINEAIGGTSAKSFYNNHWAPVISQVQSGDFVFIQFGINDRAKDERGSTGEEFKGYLKSFVAEARAKGAFPVLVSTVRRNDWRDGTLYEAYHEHPGLVREAAAETNVPLVDLDAESKALMLDLCPDYTGPYLYNIYEAGDYPNQTGGKDDNVHFQEMGAIEMAKIVVEELKELSGDENIQLLIPHIKPQYEVKIARNKIGVGLVTRTTTYPEGLNITLRAIPAADHDFLYWKHADGTLISSERLYQFTMGNEAMDIIGYFDDESTEFDCNGDMGGTAIVDNCSVCAGGETPFDPCIASLQAETICFNGEKGSTDTGYQGNGYVTFSNEAGATIAWFMDGDASNGEYVLAIRYANGSNDTYQARVLLNNTDLSEISFPSTGGANTWKAVPLPVTLKQGSNSFEMQAFSENGLPKIDAFSWSVENMREGKGTCPVSTGISLEESNTGIKVFPNPFVNHLNVESPEAITYRLYDLSGRLITSGACAGKGIINTSATPGLYQLMIITKKGTYYTKVIRQ